MKKSFTYILLAISAIVWGVSFIITKELFVSEDHITVLAILTFRLLLATVVTIPALVLTKNMERLRKGDLKWFLLLALLEPFLYSICETSGVQLVSGSMAAIIVATIPLFVPFGLAVVYKEKVRPITIIGIVVSLIGLAVMMSGGPAENQDNNPLGIAYLFGAVVIAVIFTVVLVKLVGRYKPFTITAYQNLFGCIYFIPLVLAVDGKALTMLSYSPKMILLLLALGIFCSTLAYVFYNIGVAKIGATAACICTNTIPIFSFVAALAIGQESFVWTKLLGMAIVLGGVVVAQLVKRG